MGFTMQSTGFDEVEKTFAPIGGAKDYFVVAKADHAAHVEYGTVNMSAQPYARPGTAKAMTHFSTLESKAKNLQELVILVANAIAVEWKELAPVDTGELRNSIEVEHE